MFLSCSKQVKIGKLFQVPPHGRNSQIQVPKRKIHNVKEFDKHGLNSSFFRFLHLGTGSPNKEPGFPTVLFQIFRQKVPGNRFL